MATWSMFLIVVPFRPMNSTKSLYTFRLDLFSRIQFLAGVLATTSCILLFAARSSFEWQTYQRYLLFFIKSLWAVIIYVEVLRIKRGEGSQAPRCSVVGAGVGRPTEASGEDGVQDRTMLEMMEL